MGPGISRDQGIFRRSGVTGFRRVDDVVPRDGDEAVRCNDSVYVDPDVAPTALPSTAFATVLDVIPTEAWRGGTPTLYVMRGVFTFIDQEMAGTPGRYVVVLVTDGYPSGCDNNTIAASWRT